MRGAVTRIERSRTAWTPGSPIVVTFDEGVGGNHVPALVVRKGGKHTLWRQPADHDSLLRTIDDHFGVRCLGQACTARPLGV